MKNSLMARGYFEEGRRRQEIVEALFARSHWATTVREAQESVELLLKGALRFVGIEVPRTHDVAEMLLLEQTRFSASFRRCVPRLAEISITLAKWRGPSFYGDEQYEIPPGDLFDKKKALRAVRGARFVLSFCERLFERVSNANKRNNKEGK
jgi:HEPN domain-containing protein